MKNNLKKLKLLFVLLFAVFYSCEKDLYENGLQSEPNKISVKRISFKDLDSKTILKINEKIDHVNKICIKENKNKNTNRFVYDSNYGFYIDRDNGKLVNNNGEISYTFPMYRESEENLENIIFKPLDSGELDAYIAKYNLKPEEFAELTLNEQESLEPTLQRVYFGQFEYICVDYLSYENTEELVGADSEPFYDWVIVASFCSWVQSGGGSTGNNNGGSTGGSTSDTGGNYTGSSGGTGTGSGVSTSPVNLTPKQLLVKKFKMQLTQNQQSCFNGLSPEKQQALEDFLEPVLNEDCNGNIPSDDEQFNFLEDLMSDLCAGGQTAQDAWNAFENQFLVPNEGKDFSYDQAYWENPNLTFTQQNLPSFANFNNAFPTIGGQQLAQLVGGQVLTLYTQYPNVVRGFCALKVSRALNYSGVTIPNIVTTNGNPGTVLGSDGKYYFLNAKSLNKWMQKTFGTGASNPNHLRINGCDGGPNGINFVNLTSNKKGIYSMVSYNSNWASGHADLINNSLCLSGCHFRDNPPAPIDYIDIWILN